MRRLVRKHANMPVGTLSKLVLRTSNIGTADAVGGTPIMRRGSCGTRFYRRGSAARFGDPKMLDLNLPALKSIRVVVHRRDDPLSSDTAALSSRCTRCATCKNPILKNTAGQTQSLARGKNRKMNPSCSLSGDDGQQGPRDRGERARPELGARRSSRRTAQERQLRRCCSRS